MEIVSIGNFLLVCSCCWLLFVVNSVRSLLFSYLEEVVNGLKSAEPAIQSKTQLEYQNFVEIIRKSKDELVAIGYDEFTFDIFYDVSFLSSLFDCLFD